MLFLVVPLFIYKLRIELRLGQSDAFVMIWMMLGLMWIRKRPIWGDGCLHGTRYRVYPVINVYRKMAMDVRTEDEEPLTFKDVDILGEYFDNVQHREFWIASLAIFLKYYLIDSVQPNDDRYWKRIFKEDPKKLWWWKPLAKIDTVLGRIPLVRRMAWNMVMYGQKPSK